MIKIKKDLTNHRFDNLIVLSRVEDGVRPDGRHISQWLCRCDCGNEIIVRGYSLTTGHTRSCGCIQKKRAREIKKKYNKYDLSGDYGVGYTFDGKEFLFDLEDYNLIKDYCWCIDRYGYVRSDFKKSKIKFHRLVMNCVNNMVIDHINHCKTDNRKSNLRVCTQHQNCMNKDKQRNNTSGVPGVTWSKRLNKWQAQIGYLGRMIYLGVYDEFEDAVDAREAAEEKYFGEYRFDGSNIENNDAKI